MESILRVQSQTGDLGAQLILGDCACLVAIAVEAQATQLRRREIDWIPFQYNARLGRIAAAKHGSRGRFCTEAVVDVGLEGSELLVGDRLGVEVARNVDVDDAAGVDVRREQDRWELDLAMVSKGMAMKDTLCDNVQGLDRRLKTGSKVLHEVDGNLQDACLQSEARQRRHRLCRRSRKPALSESW